MEDSSLSMTQWPNDINAHACGSAPFVPDVSGPIQNSCGSYRDSFGASGCSKYLPLYPDDRYLEQHGCEGLEDCHDGIPPGSPNWSLKPNPQRWPIGGFTTTANQSDCADCGSVEGFSVFANDNQCDKALWTGLVWLIVLYFILRVFFKSK
jgi:hypothetical protein